MTRFAIPALVLIGVVSVLSLLFELEELITVHPAH